MSKQKIDLGKTSVGLLFIRQLFPTVLGMIFSALFIITDGVFVGRGIGSEALAAVNISAPLYIFATGIGLMFGMGGAIIASIFLAQGKKKMANVISTQSILCSSFILLIFTILTISWPEKSLAVLGCPTELYDLAAEYLIWYTAFSVILGLLNSLPFFVRLNNPRYAMWCIIVGTAINIILDYIFIFIFKWGLFGAAIATVIGELIAVIALLIYLINWGPRIRLIRLKTSIRDILYAVKNGVYMMKLGVSAFLSEVTISVMFLTGNYVFKHYLGTSGVASFSIICYLFPIIFMVFNATIQSGQPIISYNYGRKLYPRVRKTLRIALLTAMGFGLCFVLISLIFNEEIVTLFIANTSSKAWQYAVKGLQLFALDYLFFSINIVIIGYFMSIENPKRATLFTILRGLMPLLGFLIMPKLFGVPGIWLAVGTGEIVTTLIILLFLYKDRQLRNRKRLSISSHKKA
ncbi:MAG: MATE family efflux transporter [Bacteroides sp.]|nr:MATE family efflux transporter [Bacteroides sp.]MDD4719596.1 MATE family efflux transporter [Bacteroides sp.]NLI63241.1 MATE family efflux transporter [Bacteroidales bacterium]